MPLSFHMFVVLKVAVLSVALLCKQPLANMGLHTEKYQRLIEDLKSLLYLDGICSTEALGLQLGG